MVGNHWSWGNLITWLGIDFFFFLKPKLQDVRHFLCLEPLDIYNIICGPHSVGRWAAADNWQEAFLRPDILHPLEAERMTPQTSFSNLPPAASPDLYVNHLYIFKIIFGDMKKLYKIKVSLFINKSFVLGGRGGYSLACLLSDCV